MSGKVRFVYDIDNDWLRDKQTGNVLCQFWNKFEEPFKDHIYWGTVVAAALNNMDKNGHFVQQTSDGAKPKLPKRSLRNELEGIKMQWKVETVGDQPISIYGEHDGFHTHGGNLNGADIIMRHVISATPIDKESAPSASSNMDRNIEILDSYFENNLQLSTSIAIAWSIIRANLVKEQKPSITNFDNTSALREELQQFLEEESPVLFEDIDLNGLATRLNDALKASQSSAPSNQDSPKLPTITKWKD